MGVPLLGNTILQEALRKLLPATRHCHHDDGKKYYCGKLQDSHNRCDLQRRLSFFKVFLSFLSLAFDDEAYCQNGRKNSGKSKCDFDGEHRDNLQKNNFFHC